MAGQAVRGDGAVTTFYSYKGGVGRSLLLANAARFLATLGKGVVAIDFDFEAPGLHFITNLLAAKAILMEAGVPTFPYLPAAQFRT